MIPSRRLPFILSTCIAVLFCAACASQHSDPHADSPAAQAANPPAPAPNRPQLTAAEAKAYSYAEVLNYAGLAGSERVDPWDPLADALYANAAPAADYTVDAAARENGSSVFNTVQAAISRAAADSAAPALRKSRLVILVKPGVYHELVYVPATRIPLTLCGGDSDAGQTRITANLDAAVSSTDYLQKFGAQFAAADPAIKAMHQSVAARSPVGTDGTAVTWIKSNGFQAKNITFENSYNKDRGDGKSECPTSGCQSAMIDGRMQIVHHQAVALMVDGADKVQFDNVRVIGYQDTLYLKSSAVGVGARSFFDHSYVEGDVDFIFGDTTAYFYRSEIKSLGDRSTSYVAAPATNLLTRYGFVFDSCKFTNDGSANALAGKFHLARQWFHNERCTPYAAVNVPGYSCSVAGTDGYTAPVGTISKRVLETVGKVVILNSRIGAHIDKAHPWSNWNAKGSLAYRPFQTDSDSYWNNLLAVGIDPVRMLGYTARTTPATTFLAEFNDRDD